MILHARRVVGEKRHSLRDISHRRFALKRALESKTARGLSGESRIKGETFSFSDLYVGKAGVDWI